MTENNNDINYALVEDSRPPLYTAMKYWGKKPHNIWYEYINFYTPKNGVYLDPFSGSAMSAFESFRAGKKTIALDINPLTSFIIEVISSNFQKEKFIAEVNIIINEIINDEIYKKLFYYKKDYPSYTIQNIKWNQDKIYEVCLEDIEKKDRLCLEPDEEDYDAVEFSYQVVFDCKYPFRKFRNSGSFSKGFIEKIGSDFSCLYTKRNLWVLSKIFSKITRVHDIDLQQQLLFAFIQTVHLATKMCVPRSKKTNRDFSTSWGRSAFLVSKKQMEMNPLLLFKNSCLGKQSALSSLEFANSYFTKKPKIADITKEKLDLNKDIDIWYGIVDVKDINKYIPNKTVDFILTDPPYGGLVQYLDLSTVWLSWLELLDNRFVPNYEKEIIVNNNSTQNDFKNSFKSGLLGLHKVLKDHSKMVLTFNNKDLSTWGSFLTAINDSGFSIEKVIHQQNKRTGESNVSDPYGTSAADFYIRCIKKSNKTKNKYLTAGKFEKLIIDTVIEIIRERNEPTPYQILFNGLLAKLSSMNFTINDFDNDIKSILNNHLNKELCIYKTANNKAGNYWWITNKSYNEDSSETLTKKVDKCLETIFAKNNNITTGQIFKEIFMHFPNGMTPDVEVIFELLNKAALNEKGYWRLRNNGRK